MTAGGEAAIGRLHEATERLVLTASELGQYAYEDSENNLDAKHRLFTSSLLQGLRRRQQRQTARLRGLSELLAYVQDQAPKLAAKCGGVGGTKSAMGGATATLAVSGQHLPVQLSRTHGR